MSTDLSSRTMQLADPGWIKIDHAALHVRGELNVIVREMYDLLNDQTVSQLCSSLGILSAGFFFIDPFRRFTRFFEDDNRPPQTYRTGYLWTNHEAERLWSDDVHRLFVNVRTAQRKHAENANIRTEDFFRHVPKEQDSSYCFGEADRTARRQYALHYVPLGEMLFTMFVWRSLGIAISRGDANRALEDISVGLQDEQDASLPCSWNGVNLLEGEDAQDNIEEKHPLHEVWNASCAKTPNLISVLEALNVTRTGTGTQGEEFGAFARFVSELGGVQDGVATQLDLQSLNQAAQRLIPRFLQSLGAHTSNPTIGEALLALERYARFPIIPFYVWNILDGSPKCYLVSPVWTSQQYYVEVDDSRSSHCYHLGLALSAVLPLCRIDWTLLSGTAGENSTRTSDADPLVIANVIRLMARPLVEEHIYSSVIRENQHSKREKIEALAREIIDGNRIQPND